MNNYYLIAIDVTSQKESILNRITLRLRRVCGDWISVDSGSRNYYQISTGLRKDGKYKIISGLDKLPEDGWMLSSFCEMDFD